MGCVWGTAALYFDEVTAYMKKQGSTVLFLNHGLVLCAYHAITLAKLFVVTLYNPQLLGRVNESTHTQNRHKIQSKF